ncbi:MAG: amidohydrolase family protein, partial [Acidobacteria bacterium]|nr:amidohydrolase family protein [Acidobacteriota bacterium]
LDPGLKKYEGMTIAQIAEAQGKDPEDALMDLVIADRGNSSGIIFIMNEDDVRAALKHPLVSFCTDSGAVALDGILGRQRSHPRAWGSAARILGKYVREERLLTLEEAIRKMTSLPARRLGLSTRGVIRPGAIADLVVFDPERIRERATCANPRLYPDGIEQVFVNGSQAVLHGELTGKQAGRVLRHGAVG